ncbi:TPA: ABC-F type ribosomal protection protein [bacterium]|mgnify:CR=1 FL=1|nr:ABC-F type ribosomal protection protein [bacterium]
MILLSIIELTNIKKTFGANRILDGISWQLNLGDKVALVGMNGSGKTTLLKIIARIMPPDSGKIRINDNIKVGYVPQQPEFDDSTILRDEISDQRIIELRQMIEQMELEMSNLKNNDIHLMEILNQYNMLCAEFESRDGYGYKAKLEKILDIMGFELTDLDKHINTFSGGQKSRIQLAKVLLQKPDVLLLDEPDSHLDLDALEWLEEFLYDYKGAFIIISHDRSLLEKVTNKTLELEFGRLNQYNGNYSYYADQRERQQKKQHYDYVNQQQEITHLKEAIESLQKWASRSSNPKLGRRVKSMEKRLDWIDPIEKPHKKSKMQLSFEFQKRSGEIVIEAISLSKRFDDHNLFSNLNFHIKWGEHVAIIGPNGSGKTTLIKILLGLDQQTSGYVNLGDNLIISYFDQEQKGLNNQKTIYNELEEDTKLTKNEAMYLLSKMLFKGEKAFKNVGELSGGERNRVMLSKLVYTKANLIVLDEPTNHLDIPSIEVLEDALIAFRGTVIFITHDRRLLSNVADRIIELKNGEVHLYPGGYDYYMMKNEAIEETAII